MFKGDAITFNRLDTWTLTFYYNKATDFLRIGAPWSGEGKWIDLPDKVRVNIDPQTGEAVGFEIADFTRNFLAKRPDLAESWEQVKPAPIALRRRENTPFIHHFLEHASQLAYQREQQLVPSKL